jgi:cytochrome c oxidase subunit 4
MAHDPAHDPEHAAPHRHPEEKPLPDWKVYVKVAAVLTVITIAEVWAYYIPAFVASRTFVPSLMIMSAAKFILVVLFYMHLRYDHRLYRSLFTGPLLIAITTVIALLFLFGKVVVRVNAGG